MAKTEDDERIERCQPDQFEGIWAVIEDAARAYRGVIPDDCWHQPYMPRQQLQRELDQGVQFCGCWCGQTLLGVMGIQQVRDVTLIRHAYVRSECQGRGIGGRLLAHLMAECNKPVLVGTWAAAHWAQRFYQRHGFQPVDPQDTALLLRRYWQIPDRQVETSVVLGDRLWQSHRRALVRHRDSAPAIECPYGHVQRIVTGGTGGIANVHAVTVTRGTTHLHAAYDEVYYVLSGEGSITLDDQSSDIRRGSVVVIPAGVPHSLEAGAGQQLEFLIFGTPAMDIQDDRARPRPPNTEQT